MLTFKQIVKQQTGAALVIVMIMMALGGLMIVPMMNWMTSGLKAVQMYDNKNDLLYAADGGIQKALWQITTYTSGPDDTFSYTMPTFTLNGKNVVAALEYTWVLEGIPGAGSDSGVTPHDDFLGLGGDANGRADVSGNYTIEIVTGSGYNNKKMDYIGVWLPPGFGYVLGSYLEFPGNVAPGPPTVTSVNGGTSVVWFKQSGYALLDNSTYTQQFKFTPAGSLPRGDVVWLRGHDESVGVYWDASIWRYKITSTATDPATGKSTQIAALASRDGGSSAGLAVITYDVQ